MAGPGPARFYSFLRFVINLLNNCSKIYIYVFWSIAEVKFLILEKDTKIKKNVVLIF